MIALFWLTAAVAVLGAVATFSLRNPVHCVLSLTATFVGLALLYLELNAQFVGFAQILVYVGAVAILVVFAILLTQGKDAPARKVFAPGVAGGIAIAAAVFAVLGWAVGYGAAGLGQADAPPPAFQEPTVLRIGQAMMSRYSLPLEVLAVLLTAALIGAVLVAMAEKVARR